MVPASRLERSGLKALLCDVRSKRNQQGEMQDSIRVLQAYVPVCV